MINFRQLCEDRGIEISPPSYTTTSVNYVNIQCPHCDDEEFRMGYNELCGFFFCFRCQWHSEADTLHKLFGGNKTTVYSILNEYKTTGTRLIPKHMTKMNDMCELPEGCGDLKKPHHVYLIDRGFNPYKLMEQWGLKGTIYMGDYAARIIAPITFNGVLCSYQGRDITGTAKLRYKA